MVDSFLPFFLASGWQRIVYRFGIGSAAKPQRLKKERGLAQCGEVCVVVVGVDIRGECAVREVRRWRCSLSASAQLLVGSGNAGLRDGSTPEARNRAGSGSGKRGARYSHLSFLLKREVSACTKSALRLTRPGPAVGRVPQGLNRREAQHYNGISAGERFTRDYPRHSGRPAPARVMKSPLC